MTFGEGLFDRVYLETEPETMLHVGTGAGGGEHGCGPTPGGVRTPPCPATSGSLSWGERAARPREGDAQAEDVWRAETNSLSIFEPVPI